MRCKTLKLEFLVNRTLQIILDERGVSHSPIASCGLHQEYENESRKKKIKRGILEWWKSRDEVMKEKRVGNKSYYLGK